MNKVILIGNVGSMPEIKTLENGAGGVPSKVASFSLATNEVYKKKDSDEKVTQTTWHRIEVWNGLVTIAENYIHKGDRLSVDGKIVIQKYTDNEGIERTSIKIRAERIELLGKRRDEVESRNESKATQKTKQGSKGKQSEKATSEAEKVVFESSPNTDEDLPF